jgi:actin-like ATPase involved in cell morphogenesis
MTIPGRHRLAVDLGTSTTIAMMQWPDGRVRPLLFDGSPLLSSAVLLGVDGQLHTGRDAAHLARRNPERLEPNPKRRIDDDVVLLGPTEVPVQDLLTAVFSRVSEEAHRVAGHLGGLTVTHPAAWGSRRRAQLAEAAERAGLGRGRLVPEPVAAATYFAHTMINRFAPGSRVVVYDLGAGTCDVTVLRRGPHGFDVVASDGLNDVGGLDVDAAIVAFLEATYGPLWTDPVSRRQVWDDVRGAKEMLSRASGTVIGIPALGQEAPLGREQFDGLIAPVLRPTVALARSLMRDTAGVAVSGASTAVVLVGGASRIPLVATLLTEATGIPPIVMEQPELVVAEGALHLAPVVSLHRPATGTATVPVSAVPVSAVPAPGPTALSEPAPVPGPADPVAPVPVSGPADPVEPASGPADPVEPVPASGPGDPTGPVSGASGPADPTAPVSGGPAVGSDDLAPVPDPPAVPVRPGRRRALVAAVVAVLVLAGAVTSIVMLNRKDPGDQRGGGGQPTASAGQPSAGATSGPPTPGRYAMTVLPEKPCTTFTLGRLATVYNRQDGPPATDVLSVNVSASYATCSMYRRDRNSDTLLISVTAVVHADTAQAVSTQKVALDNAKGTDPGLMVLTGIGQEAFAARATNISSWTMTYNAEARDGNLRLSVHGKSNIQTPTDEQMRQFGRDLAEVARSAIAKLGSS